MICLNFSPNVFHKFRLGLKKVFQLIQQFSLKLASFTCIPLIYLVIIYVLFPFSVTWSYFDKARGVANNDSNLHTFSAKMYSHALLCRTLIHPLTSTSAFSQNLLMQIWILISWFQRFFSPFSHEFGPFYIRLRPTRVSCRVSCATVHDVNVLLEYADCANKDR